jgi:hypothetical protein
MPDTLLLSKNVIAPKRFIHLRIKSNQLAARPYSANANPKAGRASTSITPKAVDR